MLGWIKAGRRNGSLRFLKLPLAMGSGTFDIYINPSHICSFSADTKGRDITHVAINGSNYMIRLSLVEFIIKLNEYEKGKVIAR